MALLPDELAQWSVRPLRSADQAGVLAFLERDDIVNAYLVSRILDEGIERLGTTVAVCYREELIAVAMLGANVVFAASRDLHADVRRMAVAIIGEEIVNCVHPPRAMVSNELLVEEVWVQIRNFVSPPTVVRLSQPVYVLDALDVPSELSSVRYSSIAELDALVPACAAMHMEEVGIDPLSRDAVGYRQRIRELVIRKRSLILVDHRTIVFKVEFSAITPATIQLMGVWTHPAYRRQGYARRGITEVCGHILKQRKRPSLFVNDFNTAAVGLYESVGFRMIGTNRALIW